MELSHQGCLMNRFWIPYNPNIPNVAHIVNCFMRSNGKTVREVLYMNSFYVGTRLKWIWLHDVTIPISKEPTNKE
jgi:hypothetical protein